MDPSESTFTGNEAQTAETVMSQGNPEVPEKESSQEDEQHEACNDGDQPIRDAIRYVSLYKAASLGDWMTAESICVDDPDALTSPIFAWKETLLHVAVASGRSASFVQKLADLMVQKGKPLGLETRDNFTALHYAAKAGNTEAARILVDKDPTLTRGINKFGIKPLHQAAEYGHYDTVKYLLPVTRIHDPSCFAGSMGANLLVLLILDGFYVLARISTYRVKAYQKGDLENPDESKTSLKGATQFGLSKDDQVIKLLRSLLEKATRLASSSKALDLIGPPSRLAARFGIHEFVAEVIKACPSSLTLTNDQLQNMFNLAIIHRQERVFNLLFQMSSWKHFTMGFDNNFNTMLHNAAKWEPSTRIGKIPGAALQMQRELQWFKAVEEFVQPSYKVEENKEEKTPQMLFTESHKELVKEGERWMKETANACTIVAALVVTVVFAAAFTVPGGNNGDNGIPIFLNESSFMVFAISNTLALVSSTTSLLMFLGILTSRYSEEDFLRALPMRLAIGLITLFFAIAAMLVAFSASIYIVLSHRVSWIAAPIALLASVPVTLFAFLQFPLLVEVVSSTFGPSIFGKQSEEILI